MYASLFRMALGLIWQPGLVREASEREAGLGG